MRMESGALIDANLAHRARIEQLEKALRFYRKGNHYKVLNGHTLLLDNGGVAETALDGDMADLDEAIAEAMLDLKD